ncbi:MAG: hypothetical protein H0X37_00325 [Herpetosiphonaceae bacterium]|nr:hypothetical protein [Herpetosiphonaceae bacterium]
MQQLTQLVQYPVRWIGGWFHFLLLVLALVAVGGGLLWERQRHTPVPPGAQNIQSTINAGVAQTSFRVAESVADVRSFYRQVMPQRGWQYCGTQGTPRCSNMIALVGGADQQTDVYRKPGDTSYRGSTVEIWPIQNPGGQVFVTIFETQPH